MPEIGPPPADWTASLLNWGDPVVRRYDGLARHIPGVTRSGIDLLIAIYAIGLCVIAVTGGVDLGVLRAHEPAKPLVVLLLTVPVRIALGGRSWLADLVRVTLRQLGSVTQLLAIRTPACVADTLFAFLVLRVASLPAAFIANLAFEPDRTRGFTLPFE